MSDKNTTKSNDEIIANIKNKYRGIRVEELNELNPSYSCIICAHLHSCVEIARISSSGLLRLDGKAGIGKCCPKCIQVSEPVFARRYDFGE